MSVLLAAGFAALSAWLWLTPGIPPNAWPGCVCAACSLPKKLAAERLRSVRLSRPY